jgi:hypothetical protein
LAVDSPLAEDAGQNPEVPARLAVCGDCLMSNAPEVPITIASSVASDVNPIVVIGAVTYQPPSSHNNSYWFSVYDRYTLQQVFSVVQVADADTVPADLAGKFNTPQYMLAVTTQNLMSSFVPAGPLHAFLVDNGASVALKRLTQALLQIGCGSLGYVSYSMVGVLGPGTPTHPRVEASIMASSDTMYLEATLVGTQVGSQTLYTPVPLTEPKP